MEYYKLNNKNQKNLEIKIKGIENIALFLIIISPD